MNVFPDSRQPNICFRSVQLKFTTNFRDLLNYARVCKSMLAAATLVKIPEPGPKSLQPNVDLKHRHIISLRGGFEYDHRCCRLHFGWVCRDCQHSTESKLRDFCKCEKCGEAWHVRGWHGRSENWCSADCDQCVFCPGEFLLDEEECLDSTCHLEPGLKGNWRNKSWYGNIDIGDGKPG